MSIISTGLREAKKPSHNLFLVTADADRAPYATALFPCENPEHGLASGQIEVGHYGYWVNMTASKSENERAPLVHVKFKPKEQQPAAQAAAGPPPDDDIPF